MPNVPLLNATVKITCKDINNNSVAKQFNTVTAIHIDYNDGTINIVDKTGSFYFPLLAATTFTYTITTGIGGVQTIVIS